MEGPGAGAGDLPVVGGEPAGGTGLRLARVLLRVPEAKDKVQFVDAPLVDLSATEIRRLASAGEPLTGRVPDEVAEYIHNQGLYLEQREGRTTS